MSWWVSFNNLFHDFSQHTSIFGFWSNFTICDNTTLSSWGTCSEAGDLMIGTSARVSESWCCQDDWQEGRGRMTAFLIAASPAETGQSHHDWVGARSGLVCRSGGDPQALGGWRSLPGPEGDLSQGELEGGRNFQIHIDQSKILSIDNSICNSRQKKWHSLRFRSTAVWFKVCCIHKSFKFFQSKKQFLTDLRGSLVCGERLCEPQCSSDDWSAVAGPERRAAEQGWSHQTENKQILFIAFYDTRSTKACIEEWQ